MLLKIFSSCLAIKSICSIVFLSAGSAWGETPHQKLKTFKIQPQRTTSASLLTPSNPIVTDLETRGFFNEEPTNWPLEPDAIAENNSEINSSEGTKEKEWRFSIQPSLLIPFSIQGTANVQGPILLRVNNLLQRRVREIEPNAILRNLKFLLLPSEITARPNNNLEFERPQSGTFDISDGLIIRSIDFDLDLDDIANFDRAIRLSSRFEAWKDRLGFTFDGQYTRVKLAGDASVGPIEVTTRNGNTITTGTADFDLEYVSEAATFALATSYHFGSDTRNQASEESSNRQFPLLFAEPYAGIRISYLAQEIKIDPGADFNADEVFLDPILGARLGFQVSERVTFGVRGDVGGFGVGTNLTWFLVAGLDWQFAQSTSLRFAYRIFDTDTDIGDDNDFSLEYQEQGIWLGFNFYL